MGGVKLTWNSTHLVFGFPEIERGPLPIAITEQGGQVFGLRIARHLLEILNTARISIPA